MAGRAGFGALAALCLALPVLAGCSAAPTVSPSARPTVSATPSPRPTAPDVPKMDASVGSVTAATVIAPVRIRFDRLGIDMSITAEGLDAKGAMALPDNAADAGWYKFSPGLAAKEGATVVAAHIDSRHDGIGPFSKLKNAVAGDVFGADGSTAAYTVSELRQVGKIDAPMGEVFDMSGPPRLSLVTCGGVFNSNTGHYLDNIIVTATPVATPTAGN